MPEPTRDEPFYVGYLKMPPAIRRFVLPWAVANMVLAIGLAVLLSQQHREPGDGSWDTGKAVTLNGWLDTDPYPVLKTVDKSYVLVEQGKRGVGARLDAVSLADGWVSVTGYVIERDGRRVLELDASSESPIQPSVQRPVVGGIHDDAFDPQAPAEDLGTHTLRGEIVDPKCYLGVMRPGDGKTHKTCATLCIRGGIPPMFVVRDKQGRTAAYLLTDARGGPLPVSYYPYIADPIELTGDVAREGDLLILHADLLSIRRLGPIDSP